MDDRIRLWSRVSKEEYEIIQQAKAVTKKQTSEFVRLAVVKYAKEKIDESNNAA